MVLCWRERVEGGREIEAGAGREDDARVGTGQSFFGMADV